MPTNSFWIDTVPGTPFPKLENDIRVDALVVGGGITGLTTAYLLLKNGLSVALVDRGRIAYRETGHTTAHITYVTDERLSQLAKHFGRNHAQAVWEAGASAMAKIQTIVADLDIDCELREVPGFLVTSTRKDEADAQCLQEEAELAASMGFDATYMAGDPVLWRQSIRFANQLKFHPRKYAQGLVEAIRLMGGQIYEHTEISEFQHGERRVTTGGKTIDYKFVVLATHVPIQGDRNALSAALLQTKLAAYSTYAIQARVDAEALPEVLWWDTADPYLYLRVDRHPDGDVVILGGEDHKTGQETETGECFRRLETKLSELIARGNPVVEHRWSGQVIESVDGLPFIGEAGDGQFLATGFAGNGMTFGTLAAMMACDAVTGSRNPWQDLFAIERKTLSSTFDYALENKDYPYYLAKGHLAGTGDKPLETISPGEGRVVRIQGRKAAAYRDEAGTLHAHSAICPHLGCIVAWNKAEQTWDCPCHGSRFQATGEVISGPAEKGLEPLKE